MPVHVRMSAVAAASECSTLKQSRLIPSKSLGGRSSGGHRVPCAEADALGCAGAQGIAAQQAAHRLDQQLHVVQRVAGHDRLQSYNRRSPQAKSQRH